MSNKKTYVVFSIIIFFAILILILAVYILRKPICKGKYLPFARKLVHLFCPPEDLYTVLLDEPLDVSVRGSNEYEITFNYIGPYRISVFPRSLSDELKGQEYDTTLEMSMEFYVDGNSVLEKNPMLNYKKSWGLGRGRGIPSCKIQIPTELPLDTKVTCILTIIEPDEYLNQKSDMRIIIGKQSEL